MDEQEVFDRFVQAIENAGGQRAWALSHGVAPAYVNDIMNKRRGLSPRVLAMIGVEAVVTYREITPEKTPDKKVKRGVIPDKPRPEGG